MSKPTIKIECTMENKSCSNTWIDPKTVFQTYPDQKENLVDPKTVFEPYPDRKIGPSGPQIKLTSKARIEENIENKTFSTTWLNPKTVFEP